MTKLIDPTSYYVVESFCKECGRTIYQYVNFDGENIVYRENWYTPTGWYHISDSTFICGNKFIDNDEDFKLKYFKTCFMQSWDVKREEFFI